MNINLIGMRGVGKSNVARRMSVLTKMPVMSTDTLITYETGMSVPEFVAAHGWTQFRERELEVLTKLAPLSGIIVDCGGGIMVDLDADGHEVFSFPKVEMLRDGGPVVWLRGDIARLAAKTIGDADRPELDSRRSAEAIMRAREPWYEQASTWQITVERGQRQAAAEAITDHYQLRPPPTSPGL